MLDATFFENDKKVVFYATGSKGASIHLTGVSVTSDENDDDDDEDEDYEEEEEEEVDQSASEEEEEYEAPAEKKERRRSNSFDSKTRKRSFEATRQESPEIVAEEDFTTPSRKKKKKKQKKSQNNEDNNFHVRMSGLKVRIVAQGEGKRLESGKKVRIQYKAMLKDGTVFDESKPDEPLIFRCGTNSIIPGVDEGVTGMRVGEIREMILPSELGYGEKGIPDVVPKNATLKFEIQRV